MAITAFAFLALTFTLARLGKLGIERVTVDGRLLGVLGALIGLPSAYLMTRLLGALLYGVGPADPITYVAVAVVLSAVALVASYLPARRATLVDPMIALRAE